MDHSSDFNPSTLFEKNDTMFAHIVSLIKSRDGDLRSLLLVRGLPGSGKSSLGKRLSSHFQGSQFETDKQFTKGGGDYEFDASLIGAAHEYTQNEVRLSLLANEPLVALTNTFTRFWEMDTYLAMAKQFGYDVIMVDLLQAHLYGLESSTLPLPPKSTLPHFKSYLDFLHLNNEHNVDRAKIQEMADRFEFSEQIITTIIATTAEQTENATLPPLQVVDKEHYLSLEVTTVDVDSNDHSDMFLACLYGCHELLQTLGIETAYPMIRKLVQRNMRGNNKKAMQGWNKFHMTLLSPPEYELLQTNGQLTAFIDIITTSIDFTDLTVPFAGLKHSFDGDNIVNNSFLDALTIVKTMLGVVTSSSAESETSTAYFLSFNKAIGPLQQVVELRQSFGLSSDAWWPHITLAFTPQDVHDASREFGIQTYQAQCSQQVAAVAADVGPEADLMTSLREDFPSSRLTELLLHSEVLASISKAFNFVVCDMKIRKGPFGDDAGYRGHPILLQLLPRGLVFLQPINTSSLEKRRIYRGLFSLRKFFGKEGMEDDGFGMSQGELNHKLNTAVAQAKTLLVMEKVNGRAGSARFFRWIDGQDYVIVGTKLSHTVGRVNAASECIDLSEEFQVALLNANNNKSGKSDEVAVAADHAAEASPEDDARFGRQALIVSNVLALQRSMKSWDEISLNWLRDRTLNGEILDPMEMHLVTIDQLQWVFLCFTDFPRAMNELAKETKDVSNPSSVLTFLSAAENYWSFLPTFHSIPLNDADGLEAKKREVLNAAKLAILDEASEGKVLYLLDDGGRIVDMIKYKTWWYIYRRSIREVTRRIFNRIEKASKVDEEEQSAARSSLEKMKVTLGNMQKAKTPNEALLSRMATMQQEIVSLESKLDGGPIEEALELQSIIDDLCSEINRKWPRKFSFVREDLGELYDPFVQQAMLLGSSFLRFVQTKLEEEKEEVSRKFHNQYPVLWDEFIADQSSK